MDEVRGYFKNDADRRCSATPYAKNNGAWTDNDGYCCWWLRSRGCGDTYAACVVGVGSIGAFGGDVYPVRPAYGLILNHKSLCGFVVEAD